MTRHKKYSMQGLNQVKKHLIGRRRKFVISDRKQGWVAVWEHVDYANFADPDIARFLSQYLETTCLCVEINEDYNIWCFQEYRDGEIVNERFLPTDYFTGKGENGDLDSYGWCHDFADRFERKHRLPYFLEDPAHLGDVSSLPKRFVFKKFSIKQPTAPRIKR
ncbi:MAG TPA: hypothetical protein VMP01_15790 [Pirellulaceae bacterium]|nr:hypothetical protein [Pirellulaceae bacterium]